MTDLELSHVLSISLLTHSELISLSISLYFSLFLSLISLVGCVLVIILYVRFKDTRLIKVSTMILQLIFAKTIPRINTLFTVTRSLLFVCENVYMIWLWYYSSQAAVDWVQLFCVEFCSLISSSSASCSNLPQRLVTWVCMASCCLWPSSTPPCWSKWTEYIESSVLEKRATKDRSLFDPGQWFV